MEAKKRAGKKGNPARPKLGAPGSQDKAPWPTLENDAMNELA